MTTPQAAAGLSLDDAAASQAAPTPQTASASAYRPDVDGLRAIAVVFVILYHLRLIPNGYVGVDIFFVISGFVVTHVTIRRRERSAGSALVSFWRRRAFRIYPALLTNCLAGLLVCICLVPPFPGVVYKAMLRTGMAATIGAANLYLYRSQSDYFSSDQSFNPFIHMWSLGVEEQFYLLFSLAFIAAPLAAFGVGSKRLAALGRVRLLALGGATAISVAFLARADPNNTLATYYLLPYRFWELGVGGLIALSSDALATWFSPQRRTAATVATALALAALLALAVTPFGGGRLSVATLVVSACASAVLIGVGCGAPSAPSRLMASRPLVAIGLISYSLYLWHWPVLIAFGLTVGLGGLALKALAVAVIAGLSLVSFFAIEQPFRRRAPGAPMARLAILATAFVGVIGLGAWAQVKPGAAYLGAAQNWAGDWLPDLDKAYAEGGKIVQRDCDLGDGSPVPASVPSRCIAASPFAAAAPTLLLLGDSFAFADWGMASVGAQDGAFALKALGHNGCNVASPPARRSASCNAYWAAAPNLATTSLTRGDAVLIAVVWAAAKDWDLDRAVATLAPVVEAARRAQASVLIQAPTPFFERAAYDCIPEWFRRDFQGCSTPRAAVEAQRRDVMAMLHAMTARYDNMRIWDPLDFVCPRATCEPFDGATPLFRDNDHLSYRESVSLGKPFERFFETRPDR